MTSALKCSVSQICLDLISILEIFHLNNLSFEINLSYFFTDIFEIFEIFNINVT